ncbi:MAG: hypothetical protein AAGA78_00615, partial [Pseudomonadota bacterium]
MTKPRLILHAGLQKTGTTAIQNVLSADRARLATNGVIYPAVRRLTKEPYSNHLAVFRWMAEGGWIMRARAKRFFNDLPADSQVVLSAENVCRLMLRGDAPKHTRQILFLREVSACLPHHAVEPVLYLRRPDAFAEAQYKEAVARGLSGAHLTFERFVVREGRRFDYPSMLARFEQTFGRMIAIGYEQASAQGLIDEFYERLGLPAPAQDRAKRTRRSLSTQGVIWLRHHLAQNRNGHRERVLFATREAGASELTQQQGGGLWPDKATLESFCERHQTSFDLPMCDSSPGPWQDPAPAWTSADFSAVDQAFAAW